ncbi:hypothetical protein [Derxia gummosa]|uniref:Uncharacterized protein n=1 Tax=Derxia gummosa DSM 723 TaxID=1121388 RepID=A0A8B6XAR3_9BURK|nr:hypothetical protein [Derxia gummosa]
MSEIKLAYFDNLSGMHVGAFTTKLLFALESADGLPGKPTFALVVPTVTCIEIARHIVMAMTDGKIRTETITSSEKFIEMIKNIEPIKAALLDGNE